MLERFSQVGEHYIMRVPDGVDLNEDFKGVADILIYDEERDVHVKISWADALKATGVAAANGIATTTTDAQGNSVDVELEGITLVRWKVAADAIANGTIGENGPTQDEIKNCAICIARPFIEHAMLSAILTVSGQDTGATIFGPSDMQVSANTSVKVIEGHYTGHFKSVVTKPQNVYVLRDIMANGYRGGGNAAFFNKDGNLTKASRKIQQRLNFDNQDRDEIFPSLLAFPMSVEQAEKLHNEISITSRLLPWDVHDKTHKSFPGGEAMYNLYAPALQLEQVHFGEDLRASENMEYMSQGSSNNALCFTGPHRVYDPLTKGFTALVPGMGHWGADARPGDARWRRGEAVSMMSAREQMLSFEQLQYLPKPKI